jgi:hypothetical protein
MTYYGWVLAYSLFRRRAVGSHVVFRCKGDENQIGRYFQDAPKNRTPGPTPVSNDQ